eukprot:TRINITY_DN9634_c0_g1_i1.p2 TRINITY_DN9634_c0_g1~~TRINITY_DN9634_c0_g1_i1.p2  ORF type:complete len:300 (+),score=95.41 TRINITY_DN9634_c0_g1_i1:102-1001(+)
MADDLEVAVLPEVRPVLGEGPSWDSTKNLLYWVDIKGGSGKIHSFDPATKQNRTMETPQWPGFVVPKKSGGLIAGLFDGLYSIDDLDATPRFTKLFDPEHNAAIRFNDGKVDPRGRVYAGTMEDAQQRAPMGHLWRLDGPGAEPQAQFGEVAISNGLAWSHDLSTFYYIDSPLQRVDAFDYEPDSGRLSNRRTVISIGAYAEEGCPDGMTIDADGMLWIAHWGGSKVTRWDPNTGSKLRTVPVPVSKVTSATFGGPNLDRLFITTASIQSDTEKEPLAGAVFVLNNPGTKGTAALPYNG